MSVDPIARGLAARANTAAGISAAGGALVSPKAVLLDVPTKAADTTGGYAVSDLWIRWPALQAYAAVSVTAGAAVWQQQANFAALPLDAVGTAAAAYGVVLLRSAYAGSAFQVTRISDSATLDVGFVSRVSGLNTVNQVADFDKADAFCAGTTGYITKWYDQSGNSLDATSPVTTGIQLLFNTVNGIRTMAFPGQRYFTLPAGISVSRISHSVVCFAQSQSSAFNSPWYELGTTATGETLYSDIAATLNVYDSSNRSFAALPETTPAAVVYVSDGSTSKASINDLSYSIAAASAATLTGGFIGYSDVSSIQAVEGDYLAFIVYARALTTLEQANIKLSLYNKFGVTPQLRDRFTVVADSLGAGLQTGGYPYWRQAMPLLNRSYRVFNAGRNGGTAASVVANTASYFTRVKSTYLAGVRNHYHVALGTNDLAMATGAVASTYADLVTICQALKALGSSVTISIGTILPRTANFSGGQTSAGFEIDRLALNVLLRANYGSFANRLVDVGANALIGPQAATTGIYYYDQIHTNVKGAAVVASVVADAINSLP